MKTFNKVALAAMIGVPAALLGTTQAQAQVAGVAIADPNAAVENSKVWAAAQSEIATTYKAQLDAAKARSDAISAELAPLYKQFDTNNDGQLSPAEIEAARSTRGAQLAQVEAKEKAANDELARMTVQPTRARQYAAEQIGAKANDAVANVVKARSISLLLRPASAFFATPTADVTALISAEIDRLIPRAAITPPANWQPGQQQGQGAASPAGAAAPTVSTPAKKQPQGR